MIAEATAEVSNPSTGTGAEQRATEINLRRDEIRDLLCMYRDTGVFVEKAALRGDRLFAEFRTFKHPFLRSEPEHLTREHALMFVTQASYLFAALFRQVDPDYPLSRDAFRRLALAERALFTRVQLNFHRVIRNRDGIVLEMWCDRFRLLGRRIFGRLSFLLPDGCDGSCDAVIVLDESMKRASA
ncbi:MAG TPA: hypothetical protein VM537_19510 [Anaerolineae bacterium]|nr:hypothetical protein [Anaerolineae bacterium]